jgi:hypothetical protein
MLDKLEKTNKEQKEYNDKVKDLRKYLDDLKEKASFDIEFPKATELDRFESWVKRNTAGFSELNAEISETRLLLAAKQSFENVDALIAKMKEAAELRKSFRDAFDREIRDFSASDNPFLSRLEKFAESLLSAKNVTINAVAKSLDGFGTNLFPQDFAAQINGYLTEIEKLQTAGLDASKVYDQLKKYLEGIGTVNITGTDGKTITQRIFGDGAEGAGKMIEKFQALKKEVNASELQSGLKKLDALMESVNLRIGDTGAKTAAEKINAIFKDPEVIKALEIRAQLLGITVDRLKEIINLSANPDTSTRPRIVGEKEEEETTPFLGESILTDLDEAGNRVTNFGNVWKEMGNIATEALGSMAQGVGNMVQNLVLLGNTGGQSFKKLAASVLAGVAMQAATLAVMETAYGIAALTPWGAAIYGSPVPHFKAAALFASVALTTGLIGRAVAGDSFRNETATGTAGLGGGASGENSGQRSGAAPVGPYSSREDQLIDVARNASMNAAGQPITIVMRSDVDFGNFIRYEISKGGDTRQAILDVR